MLRLHSLLALLLHRLAVGVVAVGLPLAQQLLALGENQLERVGRKCEAVRLHAKSRHILQDDL